VSAYRVLWLALSLPFFFGWFHLLAMLKRRHQSPTSTFAARVASFSALTIACDYGHAKRGYTNANFTFWGKNCGESKHMHTFLRQPVRLHNEAAKLAEAAGFLEKPDCSNSSLPNELLSAIIRGQPCSFAFVVDGNLPSRLCCRISPRFLWCCDEYTVALDKDREYLRHTFWKGHCLSSEIEDVPLWFMLWHDTNLASPSNSSWSWILNSIPCRMGIIMSYMTPLSQFILRGSQWARYRDEIINSLYMVNCSGTYSLSKLNFLTQNSNLFIRRLSTVAAPALTIVRIEGLALQCLPPLTGVTSLTLCKQLADNVVDLRDTLVEVLHWPPHNCDIFAEYIPTISNQASCCHHYYPSYLHQRRWRSSTRDHVLLAISAPVLESLAISHIIERFGDVSQLPNSDASVPSISQRSLFSERHVSQESWTLFCSVFPHISISPCNQLCMILSK